MGLVWKAMKKILASLLGTNCKHVNDDILLIGSRKISMSASTEISDWRNGPR